MSVGAQYVTGEEWRNNLRKNEEMEPKSKQRPAMDMTGHVNKVRWCKEPSCIGTWTVRFMNQGKLEVVKQRMARVNVDIKGYFSTYMKIGCRRDSLPVRVDKGKGGLLPGYLF